MEARPLECYASGNCNIYIYYWGYFSGEKVSVECVTGGFFHVPLACGFGEGGYFKDMSAIMKQSQKPG